MSILLARLRRLRLLMQAVLTPIKARGARQTKLRPSMLGRDLVAAQGRAP